MKISVITVCFNSEKTIERTLNSIVGQSYRDKEIIVIDGGSTDGTTAIIEKYRSHISTFISEKDAGIYDAMNKGWKKSTGQFLHFLNSDDWYFNNEVLSTAATQLKDSKTLYHGRLIYRHEAGSENQLGRPCTYKDLKYELKGIHQPASFFPRNLFESLGGFDISYRISSDYDLIRRFVKQTPTQFLNLDIVYMSDSGASAKQISTALAENYSIAVKYGENPATVNLRKHWVGFWLHVRYNYPLIFRLLKKLKDGH